MVTSNRVHLLVVDDGGREVIPRAMQQWVNDYMAKAEKNREEDWTRSIAVGSKPFVENVKKLLGIKAQGRRVVEGTNGYRLREEEFPYQAFFEVENIDIGHDSAYLLDINA